jgi:hypothetical protein
MSEETQGTPIITEADKALFEENANFVDPGLVQPEEPKKEEEEPKTPEEENEEPEQIEDPEPVVTVQDPGDFVPKDYSFEVTVYDDEGKNGKTVKVNSIDEWEALLDKDSNFGSSSALLKAQRLATKMESNLERDKADWEKQKSEFDSQVEKANERQQNIDGIAAEIEYLVSKGRLPAVDPEYKDADWRDPQIAKQPGVKEQVDLLNYYVKENKARRKAGLKDMSITEAFYELREEQQSKADKEAHKAAGEARKAAGARIAGNSPVPVTTAPKGIAVGRAGTLRDLDPGW